MKNFTKLIEIAHAEAKTHDDHVEITLNAVKSILIANKNKFTEQELKKLLKEVFM